MIKLTDVKGNNQQKALATSTPTVLHINNNHQSIFPLGGVGYMDQSKAIKSYHVLGPKIDHLP